MFQHQNIQSVRSFQSKIFSRHGDSSTQHSVSKDISGQNICSQKEHSSAKYSVSAEIPVQNIQSARRFQHTMFTRCGDSSTKYSVSKDIFLSPHQFLNARGKKKPCINTCVRCANACVRRSLFPGDGLDFGFGFGGDGGGWLMVLVNDDGCVWW